MFKEGDILEFEVHNTIDLGQKGLQFILKSKKGKKFMIPAKNYLDYNFKIGDNILCKIDKVNCSGKVFLEPLNPYYKIGETYKFSYVETKEVISDLGEKRYFIYLKDVLGKTHKILTSVFIHAEKSDRLLCNVLAVRKGRLFLSLAHNKHSIKEHNFYTFKVNEIREIEKIGKAFILTDPFGKQHYIDCEIYKNYGIRTGSLITARVEKYDERGNYKIEPRHPFYSVGDKYCFKFIEERKIGSKGDEMQDVIVVDDGFGGEAFVSPYPANYLKINPLDQLPCIVERISNATVFLKGV